MGNGQDLGAVGNLNGHAWVPEARNEEGGVDDSGGCKMEVCAEETQSGRSFGSPIGETIKICQRGENYKALMLVPEDEIPITEVSRWVIDQMEYVSKF